MNVSCAVSAWLREGESAGCGADSICGGRPVTYPPDSGAAVSGGGAVARGWKGVVIRRAGLLSVNVGAASESVVCR